MTGPGKTVSLAEALGRLRDLWRREREGRLDYKRGLMERGMSAGEVRRDGTYRSMKKRQKCLSVRMRHIVKEMNRRRVRAGERER